MARGDDLHAIKYLPLKIKGPARHWPNSLPTNSVGSWENLEDAFLDNFQGTYMRPPDDDDLSRQRPAVTCKCPGNCLGMPLPGSPNFLWSLPASY